MLRDFEEPPLIKPHKIPRKGALTALQMNQTSYAYVSHRRLCKQLEEEHIQKKRAEIIEAYIANVARNEKSDELASDSEGPDPHNCLPNIGIMAKTQAKTPNEP